MKKAAWAICGPCRQKRNKKVQALLRKKEYPNGEKGSFRLSSNGGKKGGSL